MSYRIESKTKLSGLGKLGVGTIFVSHIVGSLYAAGVISSVMTGNGPDAGPVILFFLSGIAFMAGCIMLFIGRAYTHTITPIEQPRSKVWGPSDHGTSSNQR